MNKTKNMQEIALIFEISETRFITDCKLPIIPRIGEKIQLHKRHIDDNTKNRIRRRGVKLSNIENFLLEVTDITYNSNSETIFADCDILAMQK